MCNEQNRDEQHREKEQMERLQKKRDKQSIIERKGGCSAGAEQAS